MIILLIIFGLIFGSFGSVLIYRLDKIRDQNTLKIQIKSILIWRSCCPKCKNTLWIQDLFPIFSFLMHRGRCRFCDQKISKIYPILEIRSACVFLIWYFIFDYIYWFYLFDLQFILRIFIFWLWGLIIFQDIRKMNMNMILWWVLFLSSLIYNLIFIKNNFLTIVVVLIIFLMFLWIYYFSKFWVRIRQIQMPKWFESGFGEWDVMMSLVIWLFLPIVFGDTDLYFVFYVLTNYLVLICLIWILFFVIQSLLSQIIQKTKKTQNYKNIHIPFLPSMIIWLWILIIFFEKIF